MSGIALYAAIMTDAKIDRLELESLPPSHVQGPHFLNVLRVLDMPQAVAMAAEQSRVVLENAQLADWSFAAETAKAMGWKGRLEVHSPKPN